ncbi:MAG: ferrochelatase [Bacteroidetes bacterium GWA2_31_9]|nr:MAG: ferrochelatase [Bacteroidetes bacterium GWA2_31_9]
MKGVLLVNMGGPESPEEVKEFLKRMFLDKHIIAAPIFVRKFLSFYISTTRFKKSWARYQKIGGTPIKKITKIQTNELQCKVANNYIVKYAYSYSKPFIADALIDFVKEEINDISVIPLYPQRSITTTDSVIYDIEKEKKQFPKLKINVIAEFYQNSLYVKYWKDAIDSHIIENNVHKPLLLFSAHSIPKSFIKKGDTYQKAIEESAKLISESCNLSYKVSYQSGMNPKTWLGPDTKDLIRELASKSINEIVIIPISFISENLETLYDIDQFIVPEANKLNSKMKVSRVQIPVVNETFIQLLQNLIDQK